MSGSGRAVGVPFQRSIGGVAEKVEALFLALSHLIQTNNRSNLCKMRPANLTAAGY